MEKLLYCMNRLEQFFSWKRCTVIFWMLIFLISVICLPCVIGSFYDGAGYNDESWLAMMVQYSGNGFWTSFAWYYRFMRDWGLMEMRTGVALFHAIACAVFVAGSVVYYRPFQSKIFLHALGLWALVMVVPNFFWLGGAVWAPDYKFVAFDAALIGIGFFFIGLKHTWCLLISGAAFVQIIFSLPPAAALAPLLFLILFRESISKCVVFLLGGVLGIAGFFGVVQPWDVFIENITHSSGRIAVNTPGRHGFGMMITGYMKIILGYISIVVPSAVALYFSDRLTGKRHFIFLLLTGGCIAGTFILNTLRVLSWRDGGCPAFSVTVFLVLFCYGVIRYIDDDNTKSQLANLLLISIFIIMPTLFCTGTDKGFENRLTFYVGVVFAGTVILCYLTHDRLLLNGMTLFLLLGLLAGLVFWKQHMNFNIKRHTIDAVQAGFPTKTPITEGMVWHLNEIKKYTDKCNYIANDPEHWYVLYLLKKQPLYLRSFRYYTFDDIPALLKAKQVKADDIIFFESPTYALPQEKIEAIKKTLNASHVERIILSENHIILRFTGK